MSGSLFDAPGRQAVESAASAPLAVRMRPASLDEVVGQGAPAAPGFAAAEAGRGVRCGVGDPVRASGTGKTTLASLISQATGRRFEALSALSAGVKEVRAVLDVARKALLVGEQTVLFIDEVHRFRRPSRMRCWRPSRIGSFCWSRPLPRIRRFRLWRRCFRGR